MEGVLNGPEMSQPPSEETVLCMVDNPTKSITKAGYINVGSTLKERYESHYMQKKNKLLHYRLSHKI